MGVQIFGLRFGLGECALMGLMRVMWANAPFITQALILSNVYTLKQELVALFPRVVEQRRLLKGKQKLWAHATLN